MGWCYVWILCVDGRSRYLYIVLGGYLRILGAHSVQNSNDSRLHVVEPPRGRSFIWQIGVQDRCQVDRGFYGVKSVVRGNADSLLN